MEKTNKTLEKDEVFGNIHSFESFATLDGEGIRFAVFLVGCPLRCIYCHNPDTWCCLGQAMSAAQLLAKIVRYKPYFKVSGGVTFSGGEPLVQAKFINQVAPMLKENDIKYVLDTSGAVPLTDDVMIAIDNADMLILDLKFWDKDSYTKYCGGDLDMVLALGDYAEKIGKKIWLRTVIVPNFNDDIGYIDKYLSIAKRWSSVQKYELLGFHTMGFSKYEKLGLQNKLSATSNLDNDVLVVLQQYLDKNFEEKK